MPGCDTEHCSVCGGQKISCHCEGHDQYFARWTGLWPGAAECAMLGLYSKWSPETGWVKTTADDPEGSPDLNTFYGMGLHRSFLVKPKEDRGQIRYDTKQAEKASKDNEG